MNPKPKLEPMPERDGDLYRLAETYRARLPVDGRMLIIGARYETDGASIPRILWRLAHPFQPRYVAAALVHDALYGAELLPRHRADEIFRRLLREDNVPRWKARAMWLAVRSFGWLVWRGHTPASIRKAGRLVNLQAPPATATTEDVDRLRSTSATGGASNPNAETKRIELP